LSAIDPPAQQATGAVFLIVTKLAATPVLACSEMFVAF
jgi:hypothetical protein